MLHIACKLLYQILEEIPIVFHSRTNYDLIIKALAEEFNGQFNLPV